MRKAVGYGCAWLVIGFIGLSILLPGKSASVPSTESLQQQRLDFKTRMRATGTLNIPVLNCAAKRVSDRTVETTYLIWINERGDLTTRANRDDAALDSINAIEACGGNLAALAREMKADGENLIHKGLAMAMLEEGR